MFFNQKRWNWSHSIRRPIRQLQILKLKISIRSSQEPGLRHGLRPESQQPHSECHKASSRSPSERFKDQRTDVSTGLRKACLQVCVKKSTNARVFTKTRREDHISPALRLKKRGKTDFKIMLLVHKGINGRGPKYISKVLLCYDPDLSGRLGQANPLSWESNMKN